MTIANIISVPVEKLEIVKIPGITTVKDRKNWWIAGDTENGRKLTFTFRTSASSMTFKRKVHILDAKVYEFNGVRNTEDPLSFLDPKGPVSQVVLRILVDTKIFHGSFDYLKGSGELRAYQFNLQAEPRREAPEEYTLAQHE